VRGADPPDGVLWTMLGSTGEQGATARLSYDLRLRWYRGLEVGIPDEGA
jgi:hypothetical protein